MPDLDLPLVAGPTTVIPLPSGLTTSPVGPADRGATIWLTGLPSAGKTTVAGELARLLTRTGHAVELLDGDEVRRHLSQGLGYTRADRDVNVRRIGWVASRLAAHGVKSVAAVVSPYRSARDDVRVMHDEAGLPFLEVHVATPLDVCRARDVKGLYAKYAAGAMAGMTGEDDPYEPPLAPEVVVGGTGAEAAGADGAPGLASAPEMPGTPGTRAGTAGDAANAIVKELVARGLA